MTSRLERRVGAHLRVVETVELEARLKAIEERIRTGEQSD
jgi:hypothetical protein